MKSVDLTGKSSGSSEQIVKEQFIIFMSALLKGNVEEKSSIIMRMISSTEGPVKGKQIQEVKEKIICVYFRFCFLKCFGEVVVRAPGWDSGLLGSFPSLATRSL